MFPSMLNAALALPILAPTSTSVLLEKFMSADLSQIAQEKSCDLPFDNTKISLQVDYKEDVFGRIPF